MRKGLKDTASTSLEAKAALVGVMYAFERLFSASSKTGNSITNFTALTGVGAETLQRYQYIARTVGSSNEEMAGTFQTLQNAMTEMLTNGGAPEGLAQVNKLTREKLGQFDANDAMKNPEHLLQRLQLYLQQEKNLALGNKVAASFGLSPTMISTLRQGKFNQKNLAAVPKDQIYSDQELGQLNKVYALWEKLETKIGVAVGHFNAMHGGQLVSGISEVTTKVLALAEAFVGLAEKLKAFEVIGKVFEGWTKIFEGLKTVVDQVNAINSDDKSTSGKAKAEVKDKVDTALYDMGNVLSDAINGVNDLIHSMKGDKGEMPAAKPNKNFPAAAVPQPTLKGVQPSMPKGSIPQLKPASAQSPAPHLKLVVPKIPPQAIAPKMPAHAPAPPAAAPNVNVNQTLNFQHDGKDAAKTGASVGSAVKKTFQQLSAQSQIT